MLAVVFGAEQFRTCVYGSPSTLKLTINHWNQSLRRPLQIHLPSCSACYYACNGMTVVFTTALERKWPSQIYLCVSSPNLALKLHWILPSTMPAYPPVQKEALQLAFEMDIQMCALVDIIISAGPMTSRKSNIHYDNTVSHSLLKMDLCSGEKPSSSLHQKGSRSSVFCTNHIKTSPKHGCLPVAVFSGLVSIRPLRKLFGNVKQCMRFQAQNAATPLTPTPTPSHPWQICALGIFTLDGMDYLILADFYSKVILACNLPTGQSNPHHGRMVLWSWHTRSPIHR